MKPSRAYPFRNIGGKNSTYGFITSNRVSYEVKFKPSEYLFGGETPFASFTYEFVIIQLGDNSVKTRLDPRIPATVSEIMYDFFKLREKIVLYICDNTDGKGAARDRKFDQWFSLYNRLFLVKMDFAIGYESNPYLTSLIMRIDNPYLGDVVEASRKLMGEFKK